MQTYQSLFNAIDFEHEPLPTGNRVWILHRPMFYKYSLTARADDINCVRMEHIKQVIGLKAMNGYSYYRDHLTSYDIWFPTIYDSSFGVNGMPSLGFYARDIRDQSTYAFIDFVEKLPKDIPIVTMGDIQLVQKHFASRSSWHHTYSNEDFWRSCSHYFYYRPSTFVDPVPHTLLEAIQSKHRIISPKDTNRTHHDGIDDFLSCLDSYDDRFIPDNIGNSCSCLTSSVWKDYLEQLVESCFTLQPKTLSYGFLYDWICKNL